MEQHRPPQHGERYDDVPLYFYPGDESKQAILDAVAQATDRDETNRIYEGLARHGSPFAAFLLLHDVTPTNPALLAQFTDVYSGSWEHINQLVDDEIDALGWQPELHRFQQQQGIDPHFLTWNYDALGQHLHEIYSIVELDGWHHVFHR